MGCTAYLIDTANDIQQAWLEGVKANLARKPDGGDRDQVKAIWAGECDISLGNTYYMGQMVNDDEQKAWADSVRIVFPTFEGAGTHMNVSGVAMTKSAPNKDAALKLMEWLSSDAAQKIYAETNHEFPVKPGVAASALVASWGSFTPDTLALTDLAAHRGDALKVLWLPHKPQPFFRVSLYTGLHLRPQARTIQKLFKQPHL